MKSLDQLQSFKPLSDHRQLASAPPTPVQEVRTDKLQQWQIHKWKEKPGRPDQLQETMSVHPPHQRMSTGDGEKLDVSRHCYKFVNCNCDAEASKSEWASEANWLRFTRNWSHPTNLLTVNYLVNCYFGTGGTLQALKAHLARVWMCMGVILWGTWMP